MPSSFRKAKTGIKRPLVLLEILIGLGLLSILLAFLFASMTRSAQFEAKIDQARSVLLERQKLQTRLQDLFLGLKDSSLYTARLGKEKKESLIAIFDRGVDPDPAFSGEVLSRLHLDEAQNLCLTVWPLENDGTHLPWKTEILLSGVEDFQFHFLGKKTKDGIRPVNAQLAWYDAWPEDRGGAPAIARLLIRQKGTPLSYAFFPANPEPLPTYLEGG